MASDQRIVCVTGATAGIGRATALKFLKEGWKVIAIGRRRERLEELAAEGGGALLPVTLDVGDREAVVKAFASLPDAFKPVDVLVNNAGGAHGLDKVMDASLDDWEAMLNVNIKGVLYCTRAVVNEMVKRNTGHIVNIGSVASKVAYPGGNTYGSTKAFVAQFTQSLRSDLLGTMVRATNIEPGLIESEFSVVRFKGNEEKAASVYANCQPLRPEDLAEAVYYVVSLPPYVNIDLMQILPVCQTGGGFAVAKSSGR